MRNFRLSVFPCAPFTNLCRDVVEITGRIVLLIFHEKDDLQFAGDRSAAVAHLASIGLLRAGFINFVYFRTAAYHRAGQLNLAVPNIS
jgi:hypothetical protein